MRLYNREHRWLGLDFLRLLFVISILIYHVWEFYIYADSATGTNYFLYQYYEKYWGPISIFCGIYLASLSFFLFGYQLKKFQIRYYFLFLFGIAAVQFVGNTPEDFFSLKNWEWGVFSFLMVAYFVCSQLVTSKNYQWWLVPSFMTFFLSFGEIDSWMDLGDFHQIFLPTTFSDGRLNSWFLFPWIFVILFAFSYGIFLKKKEDIYSRIKFQTADLLFLGFFVLLFAYSWVIEDPVSHIEYGKKFHQFSFWQSPWILIRYMTGFFICVRLSLFENINQVLMHLKFFRRLGDLQWSQNFWICYMAQFMWISLLSSVFKEIMLTPFIIDFLWIIIFVLSELFARQVRLNSQKLKLFQWIFVGK